MFSAAAATTRALAYPHPPFRRSSQGLLDPAGRRTLSGLVYYVFVPALIFDKLAGAITIERLLQWWPLAVNTLVSILIGLLLGNWVANLLQPEAWFRPHTVVSVAMGNVGNLPLVLIHALAQSGAVGVAGPPEEADRLAIAYVVMGMWVSMKG